MFRWLRALLRLPRDRDRKDTAPISAPSPTFREPEHTAPPVPPPVQSQVLEPRRRVSSTWPHASPLFIDVETTGLHSEDRIVSLAMMLLTEREAGKMQVERLHLLFDPCKRSHPDAERVHGYDDWLLRHQPMFFEHAAEVWDLITKADVIVAHNCDFDMRFLRSEMSRCGYELGSKPTHCTMTTARSMGMPASLAECSARLGFTRASTRHDASEDAWLCMVIYLYHFCGPALRLERLISQPVGNQLPAPPRPEGELPRRANVKRLAQRRNLFEQRQGSIEARPSPATDLAWVAKMLAG